MSIIKSNQVEEAFAKGAERMEIESFDKVWSEIMDGALNDKFLKEYIHQVAIAYAEKANENIKEEINKCGASAMLVDYIDDILDCDLNLPYKVDGIKNSRL